MNYRVTGLLGIIAIPSFIVFSYFIFLFVFFYLLRSKKESSYTTATTLSVFKGFLASPIIHIMKWGTLNRSQLIFFHNTCQIPNVRTQKRSSSVRPQRSPDHPIVFRTGIGNNSTHLVLSNLLSHLFRFFKIEAFFYNVNCIQLEQLTVVTYQMKILNYLVKWSPLKRRNIKLRLIFQCFCRNVKEWWERQGRRPNSSDECRRGEKWKSNVSCCWDLCEILSRLFSSGYSVQTKGTGVKSRINSCQKHNLSEYPLIGVIAISTVHSELPRLFPTAA